MMREHPPGVSLQKKIFAAREEKSVNAGARRKRSIRRRVRQCKMNSVTFLVMAHQGNPTRHAAIQEDCQVSSDIRHVLPRPCFLEIAIAGDKKSPAAFEYGRAFRVFEFL